MSSQNGDLNEIKRGILLLFTPGARWYRIGMNIRYAEADIRAWMEAQVSGNISTSPAKGNNNAA